MSSGPASVAEKLMEPGQEGGQCQSLEAAMLRLKLSWGPGGICHGEIWREKATESLHLHLHGA